MSVTLPQGYENKVLTGDKLYTLVSLIKQELGSKANLADMDMAVESALISLFDGVDNAPESVANYVVEYIAEHGLDTLDMSLYNGDNDEEHYSIGISADGYSAEASMAGEYEANTSYNAQEVNFEYKNITDELHYGATYGGGGFILTVDEYDPQTGSLGNRIAEFQVDALDDGTIAMNAVDANTDPIPVSLNGEQLATVEGLISELGGTPGTDTLADVFDDRSEEHIREHGFQTASDVQTAISSAVSGFVTSSDVTAAISGKQDTLVFNTAYNASSNKVATMADIPSVSAFQTASDVQTAITTAISGITSFSFEIVQALPVSNISQTTIYLVLKSSGPSGNIYTEYAYVKTGTDAQTGNDIYGWEILGDTQADIAVLSTAEVTAIWNYEPPAEEEDPGL